MADILNPAVPGAAFDAFMRDEAPATRSRSLWAHGDPPLPALYISHGAPPVFDDAHWIDQLHTWAQSLPVPKAILIVSAHWESAPLMLSASAAGTPLVYDFGGFAQRYFSMQYDTPDASALAAQVAALMPDGEPVHQHRSRGLDHGAWVPLKIMYPYGDVPVLQLSLPTHDPDTLLDIGRRLGPLREEGVLVVGSGYMTHGLPYLTRDNWTNASTPGWSVDFDDWAADALARRDLATLVHFHRAPGMPYAHPTVEHFTPLFVALGAVGDSGPAPVSVIDDVQFGLSKRSLQLT